MCFKNFGPNILRVWFKLKKCLFSALFFNLNFVVQMSADIVKLASLFMKFCLWHMYMYPLQENMLTKAVEI